MKLKILCFKILMIAMVLSTSVVAEAKSNAYDTVIKLGTKEMMKKFNMQYKALSRLSVDEETKILLKNQGKLWKEAEVFLNNPPKSTSLVPFKKYFVPLRGNIKKLIEATRIKAIRKYEESVFYAGKLFILPQRLATFYLLHGSSAEQAVEMKKKMRKDIEDYRNYLSKLDLIAQNFSLEIQDSIKKLHKNLGYFEYLGGGVSTFVPALVYKKTEKMSVRAKKLMKMLADL